MRLFQPVGGYPDKSVIGIDENGNSHTVRPDGSTELFGHAEARTNIWRPMFTLEEITNLVRGGNWEEVTPKEEPKETQPPAEQPNENADARPVIHD